MRKHDWKSYDKENCGRSIWRDMSELTKKKNKDICVHVNVHQRVTSAKEGFNNQVNRMTYSYGYQSAYFLSHPCHHSAGS